MGKKRGLDTIILLQIALGLFFIVLGILEIMDYRSGGNEIRRAFGESQVVQILIAVAFLVCGGVLLAALFIPVKNGTLQIAILSVLILWAVLVVVNNVVLIDFKGMKEKEIVEWIRDFSKDIVMLCSIWVIRVRRYL